MPIKLPDMPKGLALQLAEACNDPSQFIKLLKIHHKYEHRLVEFKPNTEQVRLLEELQQYNRIVILKPRQIGISTLLRAWSFYKAWTSQEALREGVVSHHQRSARHMHDMDKMFYAQLPELMRRGLDVDNTTTLRFADTQAEVSSFTASSKHGTRSFTLSSAHLSEFAFYTDPEETLATVTATVGDGQIIIETTPNMPGDAFHRLCEGAQDGTNGWRLVTFWWWEHDRYRQNPPTDFERTDDEQELADRYKLDDQQIYWRRTQVNTMGVAKFRREYPACLDDAFHNTGNTYLEGSIFDEIETVEFDTPEMVLEDPNYDDKYAMGVDVGGGLGLDHSVITVISCTTMQPVYMWRSNRVTPVGFADKIATVYDKYNQPRILCESNNHGHVTLYRLRELGVKNLWLSPEGKDWTTSVKSKLEAYEVFREFLVSGLIRCMPASACMELRQLIVKSINPEAPRGLHDDMAMSMALAYRCMRDLPRRQVIGFTRSLMDKRLSSARAKRIRGQVIPWRVAE